ncbi:zonular occludens toxin family protein [Citrobacter freundii]|uniref:zonular occludens toxin family protein n=1 Tax=Citrobacter freundii TaxID=546 RepID=UPI0023AFEBB8|nr:zonular occludens toxin domain-containing protein [Citrobacter freundii]
MAISAYVGIPGSGKSYEVVASVIIPSCISGRRIISNIYGLATDSIYDYCVNVKKADRSSLGEIILVQNEDVQNDNFFPYKTDSGIADNTFCRPGDLICIDEAWRIWENDKGIPDNHRSFIAEHRHFAHDETGVTCDLVVMNQSIANLPRFIKDRVETTYRMSKHVSLGLHNRYRVDVFTGIKLFKSNLTNSYQNKYDKSIFPLYKSHENGQGRELVTDKRQNIFSSKMLWFKAVGLLAMAIISVFYLFWFFAKNASTDPVQKTNGASDENIPVVSSTALPVTPSISDKWRLAGRLQRGGLSWVVLVDTSGRLRLEPSSQFSFEGMMMTGEIDGQTVTVYSGGIR